MPKVKSHRGAAKRFRITASGKILRSHAYKRHILTSKTTKRKRHRDQEALVSDGDHKRIHKLLPYGRA